MKQADVAIARVTVALREQLERQIECLTEMRPILKRIGMIMGKPRSNGSSFLDDRIALAIDNARIALDSHDLHRMAHAERNMDPYQL